MIRILINLFHSLEFFLNKSDASFYSEATNVFQKYYVVFNLSHTYYIDLQKGLAEKISPH